MIPFLIDAIRKTIQADILTLIRKAIKIKSVQNAQKIAECLAENLAVILKELFIYERYQFTMLCRNELNFGNIPIRKWPDKRGKYVNYHPKFDVVFGADLED